MDLFDAIRTRRSIGRLDGEVGEDDLRAMLEAALWAPNHRLTEPWRFTVVRGAARVRLGEAWATLATVDPGLSDEQRKAVLQKEARKPLRAPVVIAVSVRVAPQDAELADEDFAAAAAATQNLLLAAHALGYGSIWRTGEMALRPEIISHLGLERDERIVGFVYVGRVAMELPPAQARSFEKAVRYLA